METETMISSSPSLPPLVSFFASLRDDLDLDDDIDLVVDNPLSHGCQPRRRIPSSHSSVVVSEWLKILTGNNDKEERGGKLATISHNYTHSVSSGSNHSSSSSRRWATDETLNTVNTAKKATTAPLPLPIRHKSPTIHVHKKKATTPTVGEPHDGPVPCPVRKVSLVDGKETATPQQEQERLLISPPKPRRVWMSSATSDLLLRYPIIDDEGEEEDDEYILEEEDENGDCYNICDNDLPTSGLRSASPRSTMVWRSAIPSTTSTASEKIPTRALSRYYKRSLSRTLLSDEPSPKPQQLRKHTPQNNAGGLLDHRSPPLQPMRQLSKALL